MLCSDICACLQSKTLCVHEGESECTGAACEDSLTQPVQCSEPHNMETAQLEFHIQQGYGKAFLSAHLRGFSG